MPCTCESPELEACEVEHRVVVSGRIFDGRVRSQRCRACGEHRTKPEDVRRRERSVARQVALEGPMTGSALRFMRGTIPMPAAKLAQLLRVETKTIASWEDNEAPVGAGAWELVRDLVIASERNR